MVGAEAHCALLTCSSKLAFVVRGLAIGQVGQDLPEVGKLLELRPLGGDERAVRDSINALAGEAHARKSSRQKVPQVLAADDRLRVLLRDRPALCAGYG